MITLNPVLLDKIRGINWFHNVGAPLTIPQLIDTIQIRTWEEVQLYYHGEEWEDAKLEAQNALTSFLSRSHKAEYQEWNKLNAAAREFLKNDVEEKVLPYAQAHNLDKVFLSTLQWSLVGALREDAYKECNPPVRFFTDLLDIYEAGHFPCGWVEGKWPEGKLVVLQRVTAVPPGCRRPRGAG